MSNLIEHAKKEFLALGYTPLEIEQEEGPNKWMQEKILELLKVFSNQGHGGLSACYCIELFAKLAKFEPISPLTGENSEWVEVGSGVLQNKRCSRVFRQPDRFNGQAYDIEGKVFVENDGTTYISEDSFTPIVFPYTPKTEYVRINKEPRMK